jgi:hypothetical protein
MMLTSNSQLLLLTTMQNNSKFAGGALIQKELQAYAGFIAYQECFQKGDSSKRMDLKEMMRSQFFGDPSNPDCVGLAEQLVGGVGPFAGLYTGDRRTPW